VTCDIGNMAAGAQVATTVTITPASFGQYTNTASVTATSQDPNLTNNDAEATVDVLDPGSVAIDLSVQKGASIDTVSSGETMSYTVTVTNGGTIQASGVTLTDLLPADVSFVSSDPSQGICNEDTDTVTCDLGNVDGLQTATVTIIVTVDATAWSQITNTAHVTGDQSDPAPANDTDTAVTAVEGGIPPVPGLTPVGLTAMAGLAAFLLLTLHRRNRDLPTVQATRR